MFTFGFISIYGGIWSNKVEISLCSPFLIYNYVFWKSCYGYHSNSRIDTWYVLELLLTVLSQNIYFMWSIIAVSWDTGQWKGQLFEEG